GGQGADHAGIIPSSAAEDRPSVPVTAPAIQSSADAADPAYPASSVTLADCVAVATSTAARNLPTPGTADAKASTGTAPATDETGEPPKAAKPRSRWAESASASGRTSRNPVPGA